MTPSNLSLGIGALAGIVATTIIFGYGTAPDRCRIVTQVYRYAHDDSLPLRGSSEDGLTLAESSAIDTANTVSKALGVSCYIDGTSA